MANAKQNSIQEQIKEENNSIRRMLQEMPNLKITQNENAMVTSGIFIKELKMLIDEKVAQKKEEIISVARSILGRHSEEILEECHINRLNEDSVLKDYRDALGNIANVYGEAFKTVLTFMLDFQAQELKATIECKGLKQQRNEIKRSTAYKIYETKEKVLKKEVKELLDSNLKEANQKLYELQVLSMENPLEEINQQIQQKIEEIIKQQEKTSKCMAKLEEITQKAKEEIEKYADISEKSMQVISKEGSFLQKLFAFLKEGKQ